MKTMRVALNLANLRGHGSSQVGRGVRSGLLAAGVELAHSWVPQQWNDLTYVEPVTRVPAGAWAKLVGDNVSLLRGLRRFGADRLFSVGDTGTLRPGMPHLLMVQQPYLAYSSDDVDFFISTRFRAKLQFLQAYFRAGLAGVSHFTVQTQDMKRRLAGRWHLDPKLISVIPSSVDEYVLNLATVSNVESSTGENRSRRSLCYLASPSPHKNHEVLAPMMAVLRRDYPDLLCHLTVRRDDVPQLAVEAERRGVGDAFVFHGALNRVESLQLLASASVAVIPSKLESFGIPYYEALALGVPVVVADRAFAKEACGDAAEYVDANDGRAFAQQVGSLLGDSRRLKDAREASRKRFADVHVGWDELGRRYAGILEVMG